MNPVLVISERDNVATALETIEPGRALALNGTRLTATDRIPRGHKIALRVIRAGESVLKYGNPIGTATVDIQPGEHVHIHNVSSGRGRGDLARVAASAPRLAEPLDLDDDEIATESV
jgi:altronate dehydratase